MISIMRARLNELSLQEREQFDIMYNSVGENRIIEFNKYETILKEMRSLRVKLNVLSFIPERYIDATLETYTPDSVDSDEYDKIKKYSGEIEKYISNGVGIMLSGSNGNGKTHLLFSLLRIGALYGHKVIAVDFSQTKNATFEDRAQIIEKSNECKMIGIDDLRIEGANEYNVELFFSIMNNAYNNKTALIITTNLGKTDIVKRFGNSVYSRLREMVNPVVLIGTDKRQEKKGATL